MKKTILLLLMIFLCLSLTGCNNEDIKLNLQSFNLNFRYFLLPKTESVQSVKIDSIDLESDNITLKDLEVVDGMIYDIYKTCSEKNFYINNFEKNEIFYEKISKYIDDIFYDKIIEENSFKKSLDNIFEKENVEFYDSQIISINQKNHEKYYQAEIICINEELPFLIQYVNFYVNENNKILKIELLDELQQYDNTTKPLNKNSLLNEENIHIDFMNYFIELKNRLTNGALFDKYNLVISNEILTTDNDNNLTQEDIDSVEYKEEMEIQLNSLINSLNLELDKDVLKEFFIMGEGTFVNTFVTEYQIQDYNSLALSYYTVKSVSKGHIKTFVFTFDRIENKITNIQIQE